MVNRSKGGGSWMLRVDGLNLSPQIFQRSNGQGEKEARVVGTFWTLGWVSDQRVGIKRAFGNEGSFPALRSAHDLVEEIKSGLGREGAISAIGWAPRSKGGGLKAPFSAPSLYLFGSSFLSLAQSLTSQPLAPLLRLIFSLFFSVQTLIWGPYSKKTSAQLAYTFPLSFLLSVNL